MPKDYNTTASKLMLDAYFIFRSNLPEKDATGREYKKCFKTTEDIASELSTMVNIDFDEIVGYMRQHGYAVATQPDGTIAWAIWEKVMLIK